MFCVHTFGMNYKSLKHEFVGLWSFNLASNLLLYLPVEIQIISQVILYLSTIQIFENMITRNNCSIAMIYSQKWNRNEWNFWKIVLKPFTSRKQNLKGKWAKNWGSNNLMSKSLAVNSLTRNLNSVNKS